MKNRLKMASTAALLVAALTGFAPNIAHANNAHVEEAIRSFGDLSMFYQAMRNSGVARELRPDQHYTILAPINAAFAPLQPDTYPCFYSVQCRPQIAALIENHIIAGRHDLRDLITYGQGIQTEGTHRVLAEQPYVGQYTVDGRTILSKAEVEGNIVYRINGLLADPRELGIFQTVNYVVPEGTVTTEKTITTYTTSSPEAVDTTEYPSSDMPVTEKTTVIHSYTTEQ